MNFHVHSCEASYTNYVKNVHVEHHTGEIPQFLGSFSHTKLLSTGNLTQEQKEQLYLHHTNKLRKSLLASRDTTKYKKLASAI